MSEVTTLEVEGMTCSNCAQGITRFLEKKGLENIRVDFSSGEVGFKEVDKVRMSDIVTGINNLGYHVVSNEDNTALNSKKSFFKSIEFRFLFCALFTLPLIAHMFIDHHLLHNQWVQLLLCIPVYISGLLYFGKSAYASLKSGIPNMDVLILTGATAAFFYSLAGIFISLGVNASEYMFFETSATIITLVLLGNLIEKRTVNKTTSALKELLAMQPTLANKISIGKNLEEIITNVEVKNIKKYDAVIINTGDVVPVDGKIYFGTASIDESSLTGESVPVEKEKDDLVMAGSILINGSIKIVTEKTGNSTVLSGIIELVKQAQATKPVIQKLGDKVSAWFVPAVIVISILSFLIGYYIFNISATQALMNAIGVLVISCPCAMGLATPTAVAAGLGKAARQGIIVKGGATLEKFDKIKTAVFDKTGTLTTGKFKISSLLITSGNEQEIKNILYSLELHSTHPLAISIVKELKNNITSTLLFDKIVEEKGLGIRAEDTEGNKYLIGSYKTHQHLDPDKSHQVYLSKNNILLATVDLEDEIRPGAAELTEWLKAEGITPVILSGDNEIRCRKVAEFLKIDEIYFSKLPHEKTEIIKSLKTRGSLMMAGDGINDAPSLELADIGLSFGDATKIAINSAQVILLNNTSLLLIKDAIRAGRLTLATIKQNLFWAFFYNVIAIPVAAMGFLSPMVAALSMAFSDVIVIGNSLRLRFRK